MIINQNSPAAEEFRAMYDPIKAAGIIEAPHNAKSMQGLYDRKELLTFPGVASYTAALICHKFLWRLRAKCSPTVVMRVLSNEFMLAQPFTTALC